MAGRVGRETDRGESDVKREGGGGRYCYPYAHAEQEGIAGRDCGVPMCLPAICAM